MIIISRLVLHSFLFYFFLFKLIHYFNHSFLYRSTRAWTLWSAPAWTLWCDSWWNELLFHLTFWEFASFYLDGKSFSVCRASLSDDGLRTTFQKIFKKPTSGMSWRWSAPVINNLQISTIKMFWLILYFNLVDGDYTYTTYYTKDGQLRSSEQPFCEELNFHLLSACRLGWPPYSTWSLSIDLLFRRQWDFAPFLVRLQLTIHYPIQSNGKCFPTFQYKNSH